jgi:hypothetical protein
MKLLRIVSVGFDITDQLLIKFLLLSVTREKWEYNETVHQQFIDLRKAYDSVRREILYNILMEFEEPMKLVKLIKMCLNETCSDVCIGKH